MRPTSMWKRRVVERQRFWGRKSAMRSSLSSSLLVTMRSGVTGSPRAAALGELGRAQARQLVARVAHPKAAALVKGTAIEQ